MVFCFCFRKNIEMICVGHCAGCHHIFVLSQRLIFLEHRFIRGNCQSEPIFVDLDSVLLCLRSVVF
jgi:hypothetical protein